MAFETSLKIFSISVLLKINIVIRYKMNTLLDEFINSQYYENINFYIYYSLFRIKLLLIFLTYFLILSAFFQFF